MVNKQGQTRLAQYYEYLTIEERRALEGEIVRKCLARTEQQVLSSFHRLTRHPFSLLCHLLLFLKSNRRILAPLQEKQIGSMELLATESF